MSTGAKSNFVKPLNTKMIYILKDIFLHSVKIDA